MNIENRFFTGLGDALRNIRHERCLSYNDMPDIVKMSPETLMKMEAGSYLKSVSIRCQTRAFQTIWGERWGSNPRQPVPQTGALPTELRSPLTATKFFYRQSRIKSSQIFSKNIFILMPKLTIYFLFWPNHTLIG